MRHFIYRRGAPHSHSSFVVSILRESSMRCKSASPIGHCSSAAYLTQCGATVSDFSLRGVNACVFSKRALGRPERLQAKPHLTLIADENGFGLRGDGRRVGLKFGHPVRVRLTAFSDNTFAFKQAAARRRASIRTDTGPASDPGGNYGRSELFVFRSRRHRPAWPGCRQLPL